MFPCFQFQWTQGCSAPLITSMTLETTAHLWHPCVHICLRTPVTFIHPLIPSSWALWFVGGNLQCHTFGPLSLWCYLPSVFCAAQLLWLSPPLLPFAPQLFQTLMFLAQSLIPLPLSAHDLVFCFSAAAALSWSSTINCPSLYLVPIYSSNCPFFVYIASEAASTPSPRAPTTSLCTKSCPFKPMVLNWGHLCLLGNI